MAVELVAIIITGVISFLDLGVNCFQVLLNGKTIFDCCGCHYEHKDQELAQMEVAVDAVRRASVPGKAEESTEAPS